MFIGVGAPTIRTYSTTFSGADEEPISESGNWAKQTPNIAPGVHTGWHAVEIISNKAVATAHAGTTRGGPGSGDYDDSYAYLTGTWAADQQVEGTVYIGATPAREIELLLRCSDTTTQVTTYECGYTISDGWVFFARWNGPQDDFTILDDGGGGLTSISGGLANGDKIRARIVGQTITAWYARAATPTTWVLVGSYTDNSAQKLTSGAPGIGFFSRDEGGNTIDYGFSDFSATDL